MSTQTIYDVLAACTAAVQNVSDPVYAPNSYGGPKADSATYGELAVWAAGGDMVRAAYTLRAEDNDWGQAGAMVREALEGPPGTD